MKVWKFLSAVLSIVAVVIAVYLIMVGFGTGNYAMGAAGIAFFNSLMLGVLFDKVINVEKIITLMTTQKVGENIIQLTALLTLLDNLSKEEKKCKCKAKKETPSETEPTKKRGRPAKTEK